MLPADHPLANTTKLSVTALTQSVFSADAPHTHPFIELCMQIFQNARYSSVDFFRTARVESLNQCRCCRRRYRAFCREQFRLFQHEGVISVPLEESPVSD